jgi:hypothetical protein
MKRLCVLLAILALSVGAFAQKKWVGGGLDASFKKDASSFYIAPEFGIFVTDKITVEGAAGLGFVSGLTDLKLAASARYWFDATDDICYTPGIRMELNHGIVDLLGEKYSKTGFDVILQLGVFDYEIAPNWSVRFNFCELSLNRLFDKPQAQFALKTEGSVAIKYYF